MHDIEWAIKKLNSIYNPDPPTPIREDCICKQGGTDFSKMAEQYIVTDHICQKYKYGHAITWHDITEFSLNTDDEFVIRCPICGDWEVLFYQPAPSKNDFLQWMEDSMTRFIDLVEIESQRQNWIEICQLYNKNPNEYKPPAEIICIRCGTKVINFCQSCSFWPERDSI